MSTSIWLLLLTTVVPMLKGDYDKNFCKKKMENIPLFNNNGTLPIIPDDFFVFMEQKIIENKTVSYSEEYYSQKQGMVYGFVATPDGVDRLWVDTKNDELKVGTTPTDICTDSPLEGSEYAHLIGVHEDANGKLQLSGPEVALGWNKKLRKMIKFGGSDITIDRGILTQMWHVCSYDPALDLYSYTKYYLADPGSVTFPFVSSDDQTKPVLPVMAELLFLDMKDNPVIEMNLRYDWTGFDRINYDDPIFQTPTTMLCSSKPTMQKPVPKIPSFFKFKGEQITINDPDSQTPGPPSLVYNVQRYMHQLGLFVQDFVSTPNNPDSELDKSYIKNVDDYNLGFTFSQDLNAGECSKHIIDPYGGPDAMSMSGGLVQIRDPQQFFDLDSDKYQYLGVHNMRGIECDTWGVYFTDGVSYHTQNAMYTWYFANPDWMKNHGFKNFNQPMPVTLEVRQRDVYTMFNFYEFDTMDANMIPDLSNCFHTDDIMNVEFFVAGRYDRIVAPSYEGFVRSVYVALIEQTNVGSPLRIANVEVQPATNNEIVVRLKLLDLSKLVGKGDVKDPEKLTTNAELLKSLNKVVNSGKFALNPGLFINAGNTGQQGSLTVYAKSRSVGNFKAGTFVAASKNSGSFSAGAMAGIAIGMLVAGILVGILVVYGLIRCRGGGSPASDVGLHKLGDSES